MRWVARSLRALCPRPAMASSHVEGVVASPSHHPASRLALGHVVGQAATVLDVGRPPDLGGGLGLLPRGRTLSSRSVRSTCARPRSRVRAFVPRSCARSHVFSAANGVVDGGQVTRSVLGGAAAWAPTARRGSRPSLLGQVRFIVPMRHPAGPEIGQSRHGGPPPRRRVHVPGVPGPGRICPARPTIRSTAANAARVAHPRVGARLPRWAGPLEGACACQPSRRHPRGLRHVIDHQLGVRPDLSRASTAPDPVHLERGPSTPNSGSRMGRVRQGHDPLRSRGLFDLYRRWPPDRPPRRNPPHDPTTHARQCELPASPRSSRRLIRQPTPG